MKLVFSLLAVTALFSQVSGQGGGPRGRGASCNCPQQYIPFCGTDGVTYPNRCSLDCARSTVRSLQVKFEGVCPESSGGSGGRGGGGVDRTGTPARYPVPPRRPAVQPPSYGRTPSNNVDPVECKEYRNGKAFRVECRNRLYA